MLAPSMRLSLQVLYAICGAFDLAYNGHGEPVQIRVISDRQQIPARYLEQIFQRLRRARLVASKRGPGGGYTLARPAAEITLRAIVEAVEGPLEEALTLPPASAKGASEFRPDFLWGALAARFGAALDEVSLQTLCAEAVRSEVPRQESRSPMYYI